MSASCDGFTIITSVLIVSDITISTPCGVWAYTDNCHGQFAPPSVNGFSSQQQHPRGMLCLVLSILPHQCYSSEVDLRQNYSCIYTSNLTEFVSASLWLNIFVPWSWSLWIYVTLMTILILTSLTNYCMQVLARNLTAITHWWIIWMWNQSQKSSSKTHKKTLSSCSIITWYFFGCFDELVVMFVHILLESVGRFRLQLCNLMS